MHATYAEQARKAAGKHTQQRIRNPQVKYFHVRDCTLRVSLLW